MSVSAMYAAESLAPAKPVLRIVPGQVIVPTDGMRRIWGELVSVDLKTFGSEDCGAAVCAGNLQAA